MDAVAGPSPFFVDQDDRGLNLEQPTDDPEFPTVPRPLDDGRVMTAIKVYHRPVDLRESLGQLGWQTRVERVGNGFFWGEARRA